MSYRSEEERQNKKEYYLRNKTKILQYKKGYYIKNRQKILQDKNQYYHENKGRILKRMKIYHKLWYQKNRVKIQRLIKEWALKNKERLLKYQKKWYQENKKRLLKQGREYYQKNKERFRLLHRNYNQKNIKKILEYKKIWQRYQRETNPKYRLDENMGTAIWVALKNKKAGQKWEALVGYTLEKLMKNLEKQFDRRMSWRNYGSYWAVDHIKPKAIFNYASPDDEAFKQCWSLNNLQPLEKIKNIKKGGRLVNT